ncbi:hypothetical protein [Haloarcula limicola]|nr:hypothetical protein [Halomicroarcula limicola]
MGLRQRLRGSLRREPTYECAFCRLTFDEERDHCPACGWTVREAS